MSSKQEQVLLQARHRIGSNLWAPGLMRTSGDGKVTVTEGEPKCNLFVYEMLVAAGVKQELPNEAGTLTKLRLKCNNLSTKRPYVCSQWFNGEVPGMKLVGYGMDGLNKAWPGDIVTDGHHIGIISKPQKTISASYIEGLVVENDWAWRVDQRNTVKVFRYHP